MTSARSTTCSGEDCAGGTCHVIWLRKTSRMQHSSNSNGVHGTCAHSPSWSRSGAGTHFPNTRRGWSISWAILSASQGPPASSASHTKAKKPEGPPCVSNSQYGLPLLDGCHGLATSRPTLTAYSSIVLVTKFRTALRSINLWVFIGLWLAAVSVHAAYYVSSILEAGGIQEWYARTRGYQPLTLLILRLRRSGGSRPHRSTGSEPQLTR